MYNIKQRILALILVLSISVSMFLDRSIVASANASVASGFIPFTEYWSTGSETGDTVKDWIMNVIDIFTVALCNALEFKNGNYDGIIENNRALEETWWNRLNDDGMLSEIYVEQGKDLDSTSVKCSTAFIDWLCKELNAYYVSVNKENISDYYDKTKGYYDYGSTNDVSYDLLYGSVRNGKVGVRMFQHFGKNKTLTSQYPVYGLLAENKNALTGTTYYMADLYFYNPLLADKTVEYNVGNNMKINVQAVKNGLALAANSDYAVSQGISSLSAPRGVNSTLGSLYILEDGSMGSYGGYDGDNGTTLGFCNLPSIALSDPVNVAKDPTDPFSTWKYTNLLLRTKIPFFDSYAKLEKAYKTGDLTEAVNFSKLSAFAGGYSGDDVTLDADTLKAIEKILDDNSLDIQDKIDQIGGLIGGAIGDNTEEIKKTNSWLAKIKAVLDDILSTLKSIRRWTIADTIVDAIDAIVDGADFVKSIITDIINVGINIVKSPGSAFGSVLNTVESLGDILKVKFPFCIPWDVAFLFGLLSAPPKVPHYEIPVKYGGPGSIIQIDETIVIDLADFSIISKVCRTFLLIIFCKGLLDLTFKIVNMKEGEYDRS